MPPLPRGTCSVCGAEVAMRVGGVLRQHPDHRHPMYGVAGAVREGKVPWCEGFKPINSDARERLR